MNQEINQEAKSTAPGTLFGVGVGPGDPELLTIKAIRVLERCPVVGHCPPGRRGFGREAPAAASVPHDEGEGGPAPVPRRSGRGRHGGASGGQRRGDAQPGGCLPLLHLQLCAGQGEEGRPSGAGGARGAQLLRGRRFLRPQPYRYAPAPSHYSLQALSLPGSKVVMKSGRTLPELCARLDELGLLERSSLAENVGLPGERMVPAMTRETESAGYFTTVMVWPEEKEGQL